jgi:hypothetical protein
MQTSAVSYDQIFLQVIIYSIVSISSDSNTPSLAAFGHNEISLAGSCIGFERHDPAGYTFLLIFLRAAPFVI